MAFKKKHRYLDQFPINSSFNVQLYCFCHRGKILMENAA